MFFVELYYNEQNSLSDGGSQKLGNGDGQGFYHYKRLSSVLKILDKMRTTNKVFLQHYSEWRIYSCNRSNMFQEKLNLVKVYKV